MLVAVEASVIINCLLLLQLCSNVSFLNSSPSSFYSCVSVVVVVVVVVAAVVTCVV